MNQLITQARTYIGTPYKHRGRNRRGVDCAGIVWCAYHDLGVTLPDLELYGREPHRDGLMQACVDALGEPVWRGAMGACRRDALRIGDVVVLAFIKEPHHLAWISDEALYGLGLLHADGTPRLIDGKRAHGIVLEVGLMDSQVKQIVAIFRRPL